MSHEGRIGGRSRLQPMPLVEILPQVERQLGRAADRADALGHRRLRLVLLRRELRRLRPRRPAMDREGQERRQHRHADIAETDQHRPEGKQHVALIAVVGAAVGRGAERDGKQGLLAPERPALEAVGARIGRAVDPDPVEPALHHRRRSPPPDGKLENQQIGAPHLVELGDDGRRGRGALMRAALLALGVEVAGIVSRAIVARPLDRIEALRIEVGNLDGGALRPKLPGRHPRQPPVQRLRLRLSQDDERMHGISSASGSRAVGAPDVHEIGGRLHPAHRALRRPGRQSFAGVTRPAARSSSRATRL